MSYFPEREALDPPGIADALSESLANKYGTWKNDTSYLWVVYLDHVNVISRNGAICGDSPGGSADTFGGMYFALSSPLDMSGMEEFQFRVAALNKGSPANYAGQADLILLDSALNQAWVTFGTTVDGYYTTKIFNKAMFTVDPGFDWTQVSRWLLRFYCINVNPTTWPGFWVWIDAGPFMYQELVSVNLTIDSVPQGKSFVIDGVGGTTPTTYIVNEGDVWKITVEPTDFIEWEDGSTNIERTITMGTTPITLTAYYGGNGPPPNGDGNGDGVPWIPLAVTAGAIVLSYLLYRWS